MNEREALKLALEALESDPLSHAGLVNRKNAITAIKEVLAQPEQEPIASCNGMPAYEGPLSKAQRTWVGLKESEIVSCSSVSILRFYDAIEAKLKEKNT